MASASEHVQQTVQDADYAESEQKLKQFDAEKTHTLPRIQVKYSGPTRRRVQKPVPPPAFCPPTMVQFGVDKTNLPTEPMKFTRKRLQVLPRFRV